MIDSNDRDRINESSEELHEFLREDEVRDCALLVLANKQDLPNAMSVTEITDKIQFNEIKLKNKNIIGTVATTGIGLYEGLEWISCVLTNQKIGNDLLSPLNETTEDAKNLVKVVSESSWNYFLGSYSSKIKDFFRFN